MFLSRATNADSNERELIQKYYRAAQAFHNWGMEVFQIILPAYVTGAEYFVVFAMFQAIRMNSAELYMPTMSLTIGVLCFVILKLALESGAKLTEASRDFGKPPYVNGQEKLSKMDTAFLCSCRPLILTVGHTFRISRDTFPTISQDIILSGLINLLLTF